MNNKKQNKKAYMRFLFSVFIIQNRLTVRYNRHNHYSGRHPVEIEIRYTNFKKVVSEILLNKYYLAQHRKKFKGVLNELTRVQRSGRIVSFK
jgi:hypothetical protein